MLELNFQDPESICVSPCISEYLAHRSSYLVSQLTLASQNCTGLPPVCVCNKCPNRLTWPNRRWPTRRNYYWFYIRFLGFVYVHFERGLNVYGVCHKRARHFGVGVLRLGKTTNRPLLRRIQCISMNININIKSLLGTRIPDSSPGFSPHWIHARSIGFQLKTIPFVRRTLALK